MKATITHILIFSGIVLLSTTADGALASQGSEDIAAALGGGAAAAGEGGDQASRAAALADSNWNIIKSKLGKDSNKPVGRAAYSLVGMIKTKIFREHQKESKTWIDNMQGSLNDYIDEHPSIPSDEKFSLKQKVNESNRIALDKCKEQGLEKKFRTDEQCRGAMGDMLVLTNQVVSKYPPASAGAPAAGGAPAATSAAAGGRQKTILNIRPLTNAARGKETLRKSK